MRKSAWGSAVSRVLSECQGDPDMERALREIPVADPHQWAELLARRSDAVCRGAHDAACDSEDAAARREYRTALLGLFGSAAAAIESYDRWTAWRYVMRLRRDEDPRQLWFPFCEEA